MKLHLLVPSLFWPETSLPEIYRDLPLPALETLLARSLYAEDQSQGVEAWLCSAFGVAQQQDWPVASVTLQADSAGQVNARNDYWLRADPVHLRIERDQFVLADSRIFQISAAEANQLTDLLNQHFAGDDLNLSVSETGRQQLVFLPLQSDRWYLRVAGIPALQTHALSEVAGKNIRARLPYGMDHLFWQGIFNEIQMLLHEHPLNQAREARGQPAINSIWFWGGGIKPQSGGCPYSQVWSNDALPRSLALAHGVDHAELPPAATAWQQQFSAPGDHLAVLDALHANAQYGDAYSWRENLKKLEQDWFAPLLAALKQGKLDQLTLTAMGGDRNRNFTVSRGDLWKFWRAAKPLSTYAISRTAPG